MVLLVGVCIWLVDSFLNQSQQPTKMVDSCDEQLKLGMEMTSNLKDSKHLNCGLYK